MYLHITPSLSFNNSCDQTKFRLQLNTDHDDHVDEIEEYWKARYLSAMEATWRILGFHITKKEPSVTALSVHLPNDRHHQPYLRNNVNPDSASQLIHYFDRPRGTFTYDNVVRRFDDVLYTEFFSLFYIKKYEQRNVNHPNYFTPSSCTDRNNIPTLHIVLRQPTSRHYSRIQSAPITMKELFHL